MRTFKRLTLAVWLALAVLLTARARADDTVKVLYSDPDSQMLSVMEGFKKAMEQVRPVELVELPSDKDTLKKQFQDLNKAKPPLVVAIGTRTTMLAREMLSNVPVLFTYAVDNSTTQLRGPQMRGINYTIRAQDQLQILRRIYPGLRRLGVVYNPANSGFEVNWMEEAAQSAGVSLLKFRVDVDQDIERALTSLTGKIDMLWMPDDPMLLRVENLREILRYSLRDNTLLYTFSPVHVNSGAALSLSPSGKATGAQLAVMASKVLLGTPVEQLPMEWPKTLEVGLNVGILKRIGRQDDVTINALVFAAEEKHDVKVVR